MEDRLNLLDIPTEILHMISQWLPTKSRLNFRLVSHTMNDAALCSMFENVTNLLSSSKIFFTYPGLTSDNNLRIAQQIDLIVIEPISVKDCEYTHHIVINKNRDHTRSRKIDDIRIGPDCFRIIFNTKDEITLRDKFIMGKIVGIGRMYLQLKERWEELCLRTYDSWNIQISEKMVTALSDPCSSSNFEVGITLLYIESFGFPAKYGAISYRQYFIEKNLPFPDPDKSDEALRAYGYNDPVAYRAAYLEYLECIC